MVRSVRWTMATALALALAVPAAIGQDVSVPVDSSTSTPAADASSSAAASAPDANAVAPVGTGVPTWIERKSSDSTAELTELQNSLSLSQGRIDQLKSEVDAMKGDRDKQNAALIAAGTRVKAAETEIASVQNRIGDLIVQELDTRGRLDGTNASISNVLAALERISANPPPALIVDPSDALGSARSAILISAILPQLQAKANQVIADIGRLQDIRVAAQGQEQTLKANFDVLEEEQLRIATLIQAQKTNESVVNTTLAAEQQEAAAMADKAAQLKQLIADLGKQANAVASAADTMAPGNADATAPALENDTVQLALADTGRQQPAVPFSSAKGFLDFPVSGVNVVNYGDGDGLGGISKGVSVVTRAEAPVLAPADGWVLYKGTYLNYGQIVILDAGQDYTILLAGLATVDVTPGQFVLMGTRLGTMGSRTIGRTVATSAGAQRPTLYIEMRDKNQPIDPSGWWAAPQTPTQSG